MIKQPNKTDKLCLKLVQKMQIVDLQFVALYKAEI